MHAAAERLTVELETALLRELRQTYLDLNASFFKSGLVAPAIELTDSTVNLGRWVPDVRAIEIARALVLGHPWGVVVEVLKHEMAHQYVNEVLGQTSETAHGPAFRKVCERLGIDPSASGLPSSAVSEGEGKILERIARLLALAESSNVHEAEAAMAAAQRLMLKYNLDEVRQRTPHGYGFRHLGQPTGRVNEAQRMLAAILGKHFFVEVIWVPVYRPLEQKQGSVLEVCGTAANLEMAAYVHAFLAHTAEQLWRSHKKAQRIRGDRDRRTYLSGVMTGFLEKLDTQRVAQKEQGLVWVQDADLGSFYRRRHPHVHNIRHAGPARTEAHAHGREAGRNIVLHKPVQGGAAGAPGLLLPARRG